jgi:hypothetical protein
VSVLTRPYPSLSGLACSLWSSLRYPRRNLQRPACVAGRLNIPSIRIGEAALPVRIAVANLQKLCLYFDPRDIALQFRTGEALRLVRTYEALLLVRTYEAPLQIVFSKLRFRSYFRSIASGSYFRSVASGRVMPVHYPHMHSACAGLAGQQRQAGFPVCSPASASRVKCYTAWCRWCGHASCDF